MNGGSAFRRPPFFRGVTRDSPTPSESEHPSRTTSSHRSRSGSGSTRRTHTRPDTGRIRRPNPQTAKESSDRNPSTPPRRQRPPASHDRRSEAGRGIRDASRRPESALLAPFSRIRHRRLPRRPRAAIVASVAGRGPQTPEPPRELRPDSDEWKDLAQCFINSVLKV